MSYVATHGWGRIYLEEVATTHVTASQPPVASTTDNGSTPLLRDTASASEDLQKTPSTRRMFRISGTFRISRMFRIRRMFRISRTFRISRCSGSAEYSGSADVQEQQNVQDLQPQLLIREHMPRNWHSIMDDDGMETVRFHGEPRFSTCHHGPRRSPRSGAPRPGGSPRTGHTL